jgi:CheY-like chemotaxis protein
MDLQMPVMDGAEATQHIRAYESAHGLKPCLIYMVSGQSGGSDKQRCMDAGANGYYVKPLSLRTLDSLIDLHFPRQ